MCFENVVFFKSYIMFKIPYVLKIRMIKLVNASFFIFQFLKILDE